MSGDKSKEDQSLLEDASTLLMFSKSNKLENEPKQQHDGYRMTPSNSIQQLPNHINPLASPGPASVALIDDVNQDRSQNVNMSDDLHSRSNSSSSGNSNKGIVAAAALAAAATIPLPLKKKDQKRHRREKFQQRQASVKEEEEEDEDTRLLQEKDKPRKRIWPVPDSYIVDPDSGVITCICGYDDDDGFTIQCDHCYRWQHAICYGIRDIETAPDNYLCNACYPRKVDAKRAKRKQQERLQPRGTKKRRKSEDFTETNTSGYESQTTSESQNDTVKRRETFMSAKESYPAVYFPLKTCDFKDKYAEMFVEKHNDDDWVISYNKKSFKPIPVEVKAYSESSHSRVFSGFPKLGVYIKQDCLEGEFIQEYLGEVDFQKKYLLDSRNSYRVWGTTKPKVLFHPHWPLYIDARQSGTLTRYLRRSCHPNVELATIKLNDPSQSVKFVLRALRDIKEGEELHIKWNWDLRHPICQIINGSSTVDSLAEPDKYLLIHSIDTVLGSCDCACGNNNKDCDLLKIKRFLQSLYRSVKSKMNNRYKLNEILHSCKGKTKRQTPILSRLAHEAITNAARADEVLINFNTAKLKYLEKREVKTHNDGTANVKEQPEKIEMGDIKPLKLDILERHSFRRYASEQPSLKETSVTVITNPYKYDESSVKNLKNLPIPIEIDVQDSGIITETITVVRNEHIPRVLAQPQLEKDQESGPHTISPLMRSTVPSGPSIAELNAASVKSTPIVDSRKPIKKLSFADYKKKQKPA